MIQFHRHTEIDKVAWDLCINQSAEASIYAQSWYLDVVNPGWSALVKDDYTAIFPLTNRKKWGIKYLYQPAFTQQLGMFSTEKTDERLLSAFLLAIPESYKLVEIQLNTENSGSFIPSPFEAKEKITHHLNLAPTFDELKKNISENTKRNIKLFEKSDHGINNNGNPEELVHLFRENRGKDVSQLTEHDYTIFLEICQAAKVRNLLNCMQVRNSDDKLIAGAVFLKTHSGYILIFTALSDKGKSSGAMSALIAQFINDHCGSKGILDFEGSMDPGIARFYKSFGSHEIVYLHLRNNRLPVLLRWLKN